MNSIRNVVRVVAIANLSYFLVEFFFAVRIGSVSLFADSIDFLEDASVNILIFLALGWSLLARKRLSKFFALLLLVPAVSVLISTLYEINNPSTPDAISLTGGVKSITAGQRLILNTAFPRIMLPISAVVIAIFKFVPTLIVFIVIKAVMGSPFSIEMLWAIPVLLITVFLALGLAITISCINVYFRDIASFLPYLTRTLLYLSPILYEASALNPNLKALEIVNPLFPILDSWSRALVQGEVPQTSSMLQGLAWATGIFFIGTYFFLSREREFAVRL